MPISGLPWWLSGKESACQCRRHEFNPQSEKIPHVMEQLSPCTTTTEPVLWNPGAASTEPTCPKVHAPQGEAIAVRSPRSTTEEESLLDATREKPASSREDPAQPKIKINK